jgi:putative flippase GtrA
MIRLQMIRMNSAMNGMMSSSDSVAAKHQLVRFVAVGALNTGVGYSVFLVLALGLGVNPAVSNTISYAIGLTIAYLLYRRFVFGATGSTHANVGRFISCFFFAFGLNQAVLNLLIYFAGWAAPIAQIFAMVTYTVVFFVLNKYVVFKAL